MKKKIIAIALIVIGAFALGACSDGDQLTDAPVGIVDDRSAFVITNADQFPNLAMKCYEGALIVTTTRNYGDAVNILPDFEGCKDGNPVPKGFEK